MFPPPVGSFVIDFQGIDMIRSRDCILWSKGETFTPVIDQAMVASGWPGGQGVRWTNSGINEPIVTYSDGRWGGFLIWGSDESADQYTAMTRQQPTYQYALMVYGSPLISTSTYERYTYASRLVPPLVALVYTPEDRLYFSLRGLWTKEDELTLSASPFAPAIPTGVVAQTPKAVNEFWLGIQVTM
jgi:hypothetical protein